ncbi:phage-related protein [Neobacillus niacini]|uniref:phage tail protein n=1 Tax=Neobacillus driksii TaxID=3035913 RepID=UPI00278010D7|nr:hypothetical protein [Neobacillus niacini]MDQ0976610.1 phage-related protein [Neobacillus niacini]
MATLADILVTLTLDTSEFNRQLQQVSRDIQNMGGDVTNTMTQTANTVQNSANQMANNLNRVSDSSRHLARTLGTDMASQLRVLQSATREFEEFGSAGRRVGHEIREEFSALPRHLQLYAQRLREAGQSTQGLARLNEMYGTRMVESMRRANDYMQQRTLQSTRLIRNMNETPLGGLSANFLRLGERMERTARQGSVLNLAIQRVGDQNNLRALRDEMRYIQQGIGRARGAFLVFGIATALSVVGLIKMSNAIDGRLIPAFDGLKKAWTGALDPFVRAFTTFVVWLMKGATAVGNIMKAFAEAHPQLSQMLWGILLLTLALGTLLAPLAVGIGLTGGLAASFGALWTMIAPFVLGFLTVAGFALILATAIIVLVASVNNLLKHSEAFRNAWSTVWEGVKTAFVDAFVKPVSEAWGRLKTSFSNLIATVTGGAGTMGNLWKWLGDHLAVIVTGIANVVLPILKGAFSILGTIVVTVIDGIIMALNWLAEMWKQHGTQIMGVMTIIWSVIKTAFGAIAGFIMEKMPQIKAIISDTFNAVMAVIDFVMKYIMPIVVGAFKIIWSVISFLMPTILSIIVGTWNNIKSVITSAINIVQNVIQLFSNILKGNWKGAWENVKAILKNAVILVWNLIQLYFLGKLLAPLRGFAKAGMGLVRGAWNGIKAIITGVLTGIRSFIVNIWNAIRSSLSGSFTGIKNLAVSTFNGLKSAIKGIFNAVKSTATSVWNGIKNAITNPIEKAKSIVLGIIKTIVKAFAGMKISIPKIKLPKVSVSTGSAFGGKVKYPKFSVNWNAKGGVFNGASILGGGQGVGEAGAEAVMPIQHKRYMKPFASAVASHLASQAGGDSRVKSSGGDKYEIIFNEPVIIREDADIQRIVDELEKRKRIAERAKGVFSY